MKYLLPAILFLYFPAYSQTSAINLQKGQKITLLTTMTAKADMGMGVEIKNNMMMNNELEVKGSDSKEYALTNTLRRVQGSMEVMGQVKEFDSDNPADTTDEPAKTLAKNVGKMTYISVNKQNGLLNLAEKKDNISAVNMTALSGIMGGSGDDFSANGAFFIIPAGKKAGDSWVEKDSVQGQLTTKTFTLSNIENNLAQVTFTSISEVTSTMQAEGNELELSMNTTSKGSISSNITNGLVIKRIIDTTLEGTLGMMGQHMPISGTNHTEVEVITSK